mmetsp:Transcript_63367/g.183555  ORF Transcript_63367/g.183555 Transcript_63367/m.183555 type:complete len:167 (+) Transcript_63367:42-542(+)
MSDSPPGSSDGEERAGAAAAASSGGGDGAPPSGSPPAPAAPTASAADGPPEPKPEPAPESQLMKNITALKQEQAQLRLEKKRVAAELRNAERRKSRLKKRARQLTDGDLLQVMQIRTSEQLAREKKEPAARPAGTGAGSSPGRDGRPRKRIRSGGGSLEVLGEPRP